jgi:hypothetical protein
MATATYLYCLVQSPRKPSASRAPRGLPGATTPAIAEAGARLWIVHAEVPLDRYGPEPLEASLKDLDWVARIALAHESVVEHFAGMRGATVIPMKLFTMFSSLDRAAAEMHERRGALRRVFERLEGCEEWGVRVLRGDQSREAAPVAKPATGAAFLAARKQARDDARNALIAAATAADEAYESLAACAADHRRRAGEAPGAVAPLLDAAFLVPTRQRARFRTAARKVAQRLLENGAQMTVTGPWPPYNFVSAAGEPT